MKIYKLSILLIIILGVAGCKSRPAATDSSKNTSTKAVTSEVCPDQYTVKLNTTEGDILIDVKKEWAPLGAQRFYTLVKENYYTDVAFFRVIDGFIAQFGISGDPNLNTKWRNNKIEDDPVKHDNTTGTVTFAMGGPGTRTTQVFINYKENKPLDKMGFAPFGIIKDMTNVNKLYSGYGEEAPKGKGPSQMLLQTKGNEYLKPAFPKMDYILNASIL